MGRIINTIITEDSISTIIITKDSDLNYIKKVIIDTEDLHFITGKVHVSSSGYAYISNRKNNVAHKVMMHTSNMTTIVDHINVDKLDNRKCNLRITTQHKNSTNKNTSRNNTGVIGIARRSNGNYEYYRASISDLTTVVEEHRVGGGKRTKRFSKQFNIKKLGDSEAFNQAKEWLRTKQIEFGYLNAIT